MAGYSEAIRWDRHSSRGDNLSEVRRRQRRPRRLWPPAVVPALHRLVEYIAWLDVEKIQYSKCANSLDKRYLRYTRILYMLRIKCSTLEWQTDERTDDHYSNHSVISRWHSRISKRSKSAVIMYHSATLSKSSFLFVCINNFHWSEGRPKYLVGNRNPNLFLTKLQLCPFPLRLSRKVERTPKVANAGYQLSGGDIGFWLYDFSYYRSCLCRFRTLRLAVYLRPNRRG